MPVSGTRSALINACGSLNLLFGVACIGWGAYALYDGANAVSALLDLRAASDPLLGDPQARQAADTITRSISAAILAMVGIVAGCAIAQGLPLVMVGLGVLFRRPWGRVLALVFAILFGLEGLALLGAASKWAVVIGLVFAAHAVLSFVALLGRGASVAFGAPEAPAPANPTQDNIDPGAIMPAPSSPAASGRLAVGVLSAALLLCVAGVVLLALRPVKFEISTQGAVPGPDGKATVQLNPVQWLAPTSWPDTGKAYNDRVTKMHEAAGKGQVSRVLEMIQMGASADDKDDKGQTALMLAAEKGHASMVVVLLLAGAQVNEKDGQGQTALMRAAENGHLGIVKLFTGATPDAAVTQVLRGQLSQVKLTAPGKDGAMKLPGLDLKLPAGALVRKEGVEVDARDAEGQTAFMKAVLKGQHATAYHLTWNGASSTTTDGKGSTAFHQIAGLPKSAAWNAASVTMYGDQVYMNPVGSTNYQVGSLAAVDAEGREAWMVAAAAGHVELVRKMLPNAALARPRLEVRDKKGKTGLELAREGKHKAVVEYVESLTATTAAPPPDTAKRPALNAALAKAVRAADVGEVEKLLREMTPAGGVDEKGQTALMVAVAGDADRVCLLLLQNVTNKDPDYLLYQDKEGGSALRLAAAKASPATFEAVLNGLSGIFERGKANWYAVLAEKGKDGKTVLDLVKARADKPTEEALETYLKGQLDRRNSRNLSGVEDAAERGMSEVIRGLVGRGASADTRVATEKTALMYAAESGHILAAQALLESFKDAGARVKYIDRTITRQNGFTSTYHKATDLAKEKQHSEIVALIEKFRAAK